MSATAPHVLTGNLEQQTHYLATLYKISLVDGLTFFRFTDHDITLTFEEFTGVFQDFSPVAGFNTTATQFQLGLVEHNKEFVGPVDAVDSNGTIVGPSFQQLRAGAMREAEVTEYIVDWRMAWAGAIALQRYWITDVEFDNEEFTAHVEGLSRWLKPRIGDSYGRNCRYDLGRDILGNISLTRGCRFNVAGATELATIATIETQRRLITVSGLTNQGDDYWTFGRIRWVSGANKNYIGQVSLWQETPNRLRLQQATPFNMTVGDQAEVEPGCNKTDDHCNGKFANRINFGGQLFIPGNDFLLKVPRK